MRFMREQRQPKAPALIRRHYNQYSVSARERVCICVRVCMCIREECTEDRFAYRLGGW